MKTIYLNLTQVIFDKFGFKLLVQMLLFYTGLPQYLESCKNLEI